MKTGTPPRLDGRTIDYSKTEEQSGDINPEKFSYVETNSLNSDHSCYITYTSTEVHEILKEGFEKSPMFTGRIKGLGPRYCPSIEDKIERFSDKNSINYLLNQKDKNCRNISKWVFHFITRGHTT